MFFTRIPGKMIQFDLRIFFHWVAKKNTQLGKGSLDKKKATGDFQCEAVKLWGRLDLLRKLWGGFVLIEG